MSDKEKQIQTEIEGIKYAMQDALLGMKVALKRLEELEETLQDNPDEF